jgi:uncharacterized repeat protein (TIGR01451 family)
MKTLGCTQHGRRPTACIVLALVLVSFAVLPGKAQALGVAAGTAIGNQASATYGDASANSYSADSNTVTTTVNSVFSVLTSTPVDQSGSANTVVYYAYTVTNTSNAGDTFALSAASAALGNTWAVALYADDNNDGIHDGGETTVTASTGLLAADTVYRFFVAVTIPIGTANGQTDDTDLTIVGTATISDTVTTLVNGPALTISKSVRNVTTVGAFAGTANADPNETLEYRITVSNGSIVDATILVLSDSDNVNTTYLANSIWIGPDGSANNGAGNVNVDDDSAGGVPCATETCGEGSVDGSGNLTAYLGNGSTEAAGGTLSNTAPVYIYFRVTVD